MVVVKLSKVVETKDKRRWSPIFNLANLVKRTKTCAIDPSISDKDYLNAFLEPVVDAGRIKARGGKPFELDKSRTSRILGGKADVPRALRKALSRFGLEAETAKCFDAFLSDCFDLTYFDQFADELICSLDTTVPLERELSERLPALTNIPNEFFSCALIASLKACNLNKNSQTIWQNGTGMLSIEVGDILSYGFGRARAEKSIVVVPVNNTFDTEITWCHEAADAPLVSDKTLHGKWLKRMLASGTDSASIAARIAAELASRGVLPRGAAVRGEASIPMYELGTIARIENNRAVFFLIALSEFDEVNRAHATKGSIYETVLKLLVAYDELGQGLDMHMPLFGSGLSRAGLSHQESFDVITKCITENRGLVHGKLFITVLPEDEHKLDLES